MPEKKQPDVKSVTFRLPSDLWRRVRVLAAKQDIKLEQFVAQAIEAHLKRGAA